MPEKELSIAHGYFSALTQSRTGTGTSQLCVVGGPFSGSSPILSKGAHLTSLCAVFLAGSCCPEMEKFSCLENRFIVLPGEGRPGISPVLMLTERETALTAPPQRLPRCTSGPALELLLDALSTHRSRAFCFFSTCFANTAKHPALCLEAVTRSLQ